LFDGEGLYYQSSGWEIGPHVSKKDKGEIIMSHGHATIWGTHIGVGRARDAKGWSQQLRDWWTAHKAARRQARLAALDACWDAQREAVRPLRADAAPDIVAAQHAFATATRLYGLAV
jgi:hypothetical protein